MKLYDQIVEYKPCNEQEICDKKLILSCLKKEKHIFTRKSTLAHMTASAWVVNQDHTKVLMCFHNIYNAWSWLGGHADGKRNLLKVALREVQEESGLQKVRPVSPDIFSLESLTVDGHFKNGAYVSSHLHLNITYLLEANDNDPLIQKADENSALAWFTPEQAVTASTEPWFQEKIYTKLNQKMKDREII